MILKNNNSTFLTIRRLPYLRVWLSAAFCCVFLFNLSFSTAAAQRENQSTEKQTAVKVANKERNTSDPAFIKLLTASEKAWLSQHPTIRVMNEPDYAPYDFRIDHQPVGYSIDYVKAIAKVMGVEIIFVQDSFSGLIEKVKKKQVDWMHSLFRYPPEREEFLNFTAPYKESVNAIVTRSGQQITTGLSSLLNKRVSSIPGDAAWELMTTKYPSIQLVPVKSYAEALKAVAFNKADATLLELPVASYLIDKLLLNNLTIAAELENNFGIDYRYRMATRKDWPELATIINKAMPLVALEQRAQMDNKWLTRTASKNRTANEDDFLSHINDNTYLRQLFTLLVVIIISSALAFGWLSHSKIDPLKLQFGNRSTKILLLLFNAFIIGMSSAAGWWALNNIENGIKKNTKESLTTIHQATKGALHLWLSEQLNDVVNTAGNEQIRSLTIQLVDQYHHNKSYKQGLALSSLRKIFGDLSQREKRLGFFVIAKDGTNIGSMRDSNMGQKNLVFSHRPDLVTRALNGEAVLVPPIPSDVPLPGLALIHDQQVSPTMFVLAPILGKNSEVIALFAERLDPNGSFSEIAKLGRVGQSGETYLLNEHGYIISNSRFRTNLINHGLIKAGEQDILSFKIVEPDSSTGDSKSANFTKMARSLIKGESGENFVGYADYRGVLVVGIWSWDDYVGVGIATEIDHEEAFSIYDSARSALILAIAITLFVAIAFSLFTVLLGRRVNRSLLEGKRQLEITVKDRTQALSESEKTFRHLFQGSRDAILIVRDEEIIDCNNSALQLFCCNTLMDMQQHDPLLRSGRKQKSGMHTRDLVMLAMAEARNKNVPLVDLELTTCSDDKFFAELSINATKWYAKNAYQVVLRDISSRKASEKQIIDAKAQAELASKAKSQFLASMSHEIRTPMNGILGMLSLLEKSILSRDQRSKLQTAHNSANALLTILNDILDFSKIEAGKLTIENIAFKPIQLLIDVVESYALLAEEKGLSLILDAVDVENIELTGDPVRIRQIIGNLLSNAIKFTKQGHITVSASLTADKLGRDKFCCKVADEGIGISAGDKTHLFDAFTQADASITRRFGGTGLGLSICAQLCRMMNGSIEVDNNPGHGSVFSFVIHFESNNVMKQSAKERRDKSQNERPDKVITTALLIEPSYPRIKIFERLCRKHRIQSRAFADMELYASEVSCSEQSPFDFVFISDSSISTKSREMLSALKECKKILLTPHTNHITRSKLQELNFDDYLTYPLNPVSFISIISNSKDEFQLDSEPSNHIKPDASNSLPILVADDNLVNQQVVSGFLQQWEFSFDLASNGEEVLKFLSDKKYALVLMDCEMPKMDGYTATRKIRSGNAGANNSDIPIIALTAHATTKARQTCTDSGMNSFLAKPFRENDLLEELQKYLSLAVKATDACATNGEFEISIPTELELVDLKHSPPPIAGHLDSYLSALSAYKNQFAEFTICSNDNVLSSDTESARAKLHSLKGASGNLGFDKIFELSRDLEGKLLAREKLPIDEMKHLQSMVASSINDANLIIDANQNIFQSENLENATELVGRAKNMLQMNELMSSSDIAQLISEIAKTVDKECAEEFSNAMTMFDYDEAIAIINRAFP